MISLKLKAARALVFEAAVNLGVTLALTVAISGLTPLGISSAYANGASCGVWNDGVSLETKLKREQTQSLRDLLLHSGQGYTRQQLAAMPEAQLVQHINHLGETNHPALLEAIRAAKEYGYRPQLTYSRPPEELPHWYYKLKTGEKRIWVESSGAVRLVERSVDGTAMRISDQFGSLAKDSHGNLGVFYVENIAGALKDRVIGRNYFKTPLEIFHHPLTIMADPLTVGRALAYQDPSRLHRSPAAAAPAFPLPPAPVLTFVPVEGQAGVVRNTLTGKEIRNELLAAQLTIHQEDAARDSKDRPSRNVRFDLAEARNEALRRVEAERNPASSYGKARGAIEVAARAAQDTSLKPLIEKARRESDFHERLNHILEIKERLYRTGKEQVATPAGYPTDGSIKQLGKARYLEGMGLKRTEIDSLKGHDVLWRFHGRDVLTMDDHWARLSGGDQGRFRNGTAYKVYLRASPRDIMAHFPEIMRSLESSSGAFQFKFAFNPEYIGRPDRAVAHFGTPEEALAFAQAYERLAAQKGIQATQEVPFTGRVGDHTSISRDNKVQSGRDLMANIIAQEVAKPNGGDLSAALRKADFNPDNFMPVQVQELVNQQVRAQAGR